jgi:hypothetical protein
MSASCGHANVVGLPCHALGTPARKTASKASWCNETFKGAAYLLNDNVDGLDGQAAALCSDTQGG